MNIFLSQYNRPDDRVLLLYSVAILCLTGLVIVCSASLQIGETRYDAPFYFVKNHAVYLTLAVLVGALVYQFPLQFMQRYAKVFLFLAFLILAIVLLPGVGKTVNGSTRWLSLAGFNVQPSEFAKVCVIVYLADYLSRKQEEVRSEWAGFLKPLSVLMVVVALLLAEPDFGTAVVIMIAVMGMIFLSGVRIHQYFALVVVSMGGAFLIAIAEPYRVKRLTSFTDPWADQFNTGYQLIQSLIAFGRGEFFGVGIGNSVQKLFYLPEAHTDFVFAVLAEETGLIGNITVILLFTVLFVTALKIGRKAERQQKFFNAYLTYGAAFLLSIQAFINIGVAMGMLPTKGLTLPLVSYGGSSLIASSILIALILRVDFETEAEINRRNKKVKVRHAK